MKYVVKSPIKSGGKIRPVGAVLDLEDVDPGLITNGVLEPYLEPAPEPAPPVPAELLQLEPLPEPIQAPVPPPVAKPEPRPAPKLPAFPKTKTKKR